MTQDKFVEYWEQQGEQGSREMRLQERLERDRIRRAIFQLAIIAGGQDPDELNAHLRVLAKERDEARREVCAADAAYVRDPNERKAHMLGYAAKRGWDCFKEVAE